MMNLKKIMKYTLLLIIICPIMVYARSGTDTITIYEALLVEAFISIHMSIFVLYPISNILSKDAKGLFIKLFIARVLILLFCDFFVTPLISIADFLLVFVGAFIIVPLLSIINKKNSFITSSTNIDNLLSQGEENELKCVNCKNSVNENDKFCSNCGAKITSKNISITISNKKITKKNPIKYTDFDRIYKQPEEKMIRDIIEKEIKKAGFNPVNDEIPKEILNKKTLLNIVFAFFFFVFIASIFIHYPIYIYIIEIIILVTLLYFLKKIDLYSYIKKQVELRPEEKISNVIISIKNNSVANTSNRQFIVFIIVILFFSLIMFATPKVFYESKDDGYAVRYYIFGITNFTEAKIPETYRGKKVISLRGNTFSNMFFLRKVELPDSITEIRGQAFKNCLLLKKVNMPKKLEYLGGGAFRNAKSLREIELPDSLTYLGGESFYGASNLKKVKLSKKLKEIRGDSFEYCKSLETITIPDSVKRIGGHAFYGASSLSEVKISSYSQLKEIGSSAFRLCPKLYQITIPRNTYVNERSFKESPTTVKRYLESNTPPNNISGNKAWIELNKSYNFTDYNIIVKMDNYPYNKDEMTYGSMFIYNNSPSKQSEFHFALSEHEKEATNIVTSVHNGYIFRIEDYNENGVLLNITKNTDYSQNYTNKQYRIFNKIGDMYILNNTNQIIKLENITNKMGRFDYYFTCDGHPFENPVGNGFNTTAIYDNVRIQISDFNPGYTVSMKIYYN